MTKIVVLGSNGQLGSDLIKVLSTGTSHNQILPLTREQIDASSENVSESLAYYVGVDYIINCIAVTNVDGCEDHPHNAFNINSSFVVKLAKFCEINGITLIHISTDYIFDGRNKIPYTEEDIANPINIYGISKYSAELAIKNYVSKFFILRVSSLFGVAGASGKGGNFVTTMLRLAREKDSWTVINDQITCPTHTLDVARAINALIKKNVTAYGVYNCVSSTHCSWFEFTQEILRQTGNNVDKVKPISYKEYSFKALRPQYSVLNVNKISKYYELPSYKNALTEYLELKK